MEFTKIDMYAGLPGFELFFLRNGEVVTRSKRLDLTLPDNPPAETQLFVQEASPLAQLAIQGAYQAGDQIRVDVTQDKTWFFLRLDVAMEETLVYCPGRSFTFTIPFDLAKVGHAPQAFSGEIHSVTVRPAQADQVAARRCLSYNPYDSHENTEIFPHAFANVETRGEAWFAARNAVDGNFANHGHGPWPFASWGINRDPLAEHTVDFGLPAAIDEIRITLRSDFPHDAFWNQVEVVLGEEVLTLPLTKTDLPQVFRLAQPILTTTARLQNLKKAEGDSPFPALTQIEYWGHIAL